VVAFDDVFPRDIDEAARERHTDAWTGDVFRIQFALEAYRPDLAQIRVDTEPTGTLLVVGLDPANRLLVDELDDIVEAFVMPDPQEVAARDSASYDSDSARSGPRADDLDELRRRSGR